MPLVQGHADPLQPKPPGAVDARHAAARGGRHGHAGAHHPGGAAAAGAQDGRRRELHLRHVRQAVRLAGGCPAAGAGGRGAASWDIDVAVFCYD